MKRSLLSALMLALLVASLAFIAGCGNKASTTPTVPTTPTKPVTPTTPTTPSTTPSSTTGNMVTIQNLAFHPAQLTVVAGTEVTWKNDDSTTHTVTGSGWDSGNIASGQEYRHTFDTPGTYDYSCTIHPSMMGQIIVQ